VIEHCLATDPSERYANGAAVLSALRQLSARLQPPPAFVMTEAETKAQPRRFAWRRRVRALAIVPVVIAGAWAAVWLGRSVVDRRATRSTLSSSLATLDANASAVDLHRSATELLRTSYREGNIDRAIQQLERALQLRSPYPLAEARLSLAYWRKNSRSPDAHWRSQALSFAETAVREDPELAFAHMAEGAALALRGQYDEASAAYDRALALDPKNPELLWRMGDLAAARKNVPEAELFYRRAVGAGPQDWEAPMRLGAFLYRQGRYSEAIPIYETATRLAPDNTRAYAALAAVYHQLDRTDEAAAVLQRSLEISPDPATYSNLGTLLYFEGRYADSISAFERSVQLGANSYVRWGNLADAQRLVAGRREQAHASYASAIDLAQQQIAAAPGDLEARSSVALYLARDGRTKEALAELARVLGQRTLIPSVLCKATIVAELAGDRAQALNLLDRALRGGYQLREVTHEPDLVRLREDAAYHRLVASSRK